MTGEVIVHLTADVLRDEDERPVAVAVFCGKTLLSAYGVGVIDADESEES